MAIYTVYMQPPPKAPADAVLVREGFNWWAFLLGALWLLARGVWLWAVLYVVAGFTVPRIGAAIGLEDFTIFTLMAAMAFSAGLWGNDWYRSSLERRGWRQIAIVQGEGREAAERRFFDRWPARHPSSRQTVATS
ncbi:MAG: hypothetical protein CMM50_15595 [Rhodospirillaceae bacterium]|nr:hypothetical protein [Rhodospirillaceae bacterium]|tara:strand:+ start:37 stop:441 length:405 start_codon:yes stop_codon:yes gene_type:complete